MDKFKVFRSKNFHNELLKLDNAIQMRVDKIEEKISENPYYGNPLGYKWFRETRYEKYRFYYIIYNDLKSVYMVAVSDKKDQQRVINTIKLFFDLFREEILEITRKDDRETT